jgi:hypothetical protein
MIIFNKLLIYQQKILKIFTQVSVNQYLTSLE